MRASTLALAVLLCASGGVSAQSGGAEEGASAAPELEALAALVLGSWEADDSRHRYEWGVGRRLLRSRSWFPEDGEWRPVSEGSWWWDGEAGTLRGVVFTVGMPMERMEYASEVEGGRVVHRVRTFGGLEGEFREVWTFGGEAYTWVLEQPDGDGWRELMGGAYRRAGGS